MDDPEIPEMVKRPPKTLKYLTRENDWEPVTIPPLLQSLTAGELESIRQVPFSCTIPCHTQTVEHAVATVSKCAKRRRTEDTQLMSVLQTVAARQELSKRVTHKLYRKE